MEALGIIADEYEKKRFPIDVPIPVEAIKFQIDPLGIMTLTEAIDLLHPAIGPGDLSWMDLGAGSGTFTEALATIIGGQGTIVAVDKDGAALERLRARVQRLPAGTASVSVVNGDITNLGSLPGLEETAFHGALLANVLHFFHDPEHLLRMVSSKLADPGRVVLIEYDRTSGSRWVPYPISMNRLPQVASDAGFGSVHIVAEQPSRFGGRLYCAVLTASGDFRTG